MQSASPRILRVECRSPEEARELFARRLPRLRQLHVTFLGTGDLCCIVDALCGMLREQNMPRLRMLICLSVSASTAACEGGSGQCRPCAQRAMHAQATLAWGNTRCGDEDVPAGYAHEDNFVRLLTTLTETRHVLTRMIVFVNHVGREPSSNSDHWHERNDVYARFQRNAQAAIERRRVAKILTKKYPRLSTDAIAAILEHVS